MSSSQGSWSKVSRIFSFKTDYSHPPLGLKWRSNTVFIVATVAIGLFTDLFLYGLVVPVLPFMLTDRIGVPESQVQRYSSALLAVFAGSSMLSSPLTGILADRMSSRQAPFLFGLAVLLLATFLLFLGTSIPVLFIARALQGMSGAFVWTVGLALCVETVGSENLGKTIGSIFSFISVGGFVAPIIGGVLYKKVGLLGVFGVSGAIIVIDLIMRLLVIEKKVAERYHLEEPNSTEDSDASTEHPRDAPETNEEREPENGESQPLLGNKPRVDEQFKLSPHKSRLARIFPILPCLGNAQLQVALWVALMQALLFGAFDSTIPLEAQELFGFDSLKAGLLFAPLGVFDLILGPLFGWLVDRFGTKPVAVLGYAYLIPVLILLRIPHAGGTDQIVIYAVLLGLSGIGMSAIGAPSIVECGAVVESYHKANPEHFGANGPYAQLYGLANMVFSFGLTVGPEIAGELKDAIGYGNMNAVLAVLCLITSILCFVFIGGVPRFLKRSSS